MKNSFYHNGEETVIITSNGSFTIDRNDFDVLDAYTGTYGFNNRGYPIWHEKDKTKMVAHKLLKPMPGTQVNYTDGNPANLCRENLRLVNVSAKLQNQSRHQHTQDFIGVMKGHKKKYLAYIGVNKTAKYLGGFKSPVAAALAYDLAKFDLHPSAPPSAFNLPHLMFSNVERELNQRLDGTQKRELELLVENFGVETVATHGL